MESGIPNEKTGRFLSLLEHELRTNLNAFVGTTQLMSKLISNCQKQNAPISANELHVYLEGLQQSNQEFQRVLDQLVDFGQIKNGQLKVQSHAIDFAQLLQTLAQSFAAKAHEKKLYFKVNYHEKASSIVYGDAERLRQVLYNLFDNAVKFTMTGGVEVDVRESHADHLIEIIIKDTGIGIAAEKLTAVFQQFTQAYGDDVGKSYQGLGLGLTLVKHLVEKQGGTVLISSQLKHGTTVQFTVPIKNQLDHATFTLNNVKLLLVDEASDWQKDIAEELRASVMSFRHYALSEANFKFQQDTSEWCPDIIVVKAIMLTQQVANFARTLKGISQFKEIRMVLLLPASEQYIYDREQALINGYDSVINNMPMALLNETLATAWNSWKQKGEVVVVQKTMQLTNRVLVIEDNLINQKVVKLLLTELGLDVEVVGNGKRALQVIDQNEYAAIFVDIGLPDINGFEVIRQLRARDDQKSKVPVIVLTADATYKNQNDYRMKGVDAYLVKPLTIQQLREILTPFFPALMAMA